MAKIAEVQEVSLKKLKPYERNAKIHGKEQVKQIANSIKEFGFISPCLIDSEHNIIAGHGRVEAAKLLKMSSVPCVYIEGLTEEQRRAYILADNRLTELGGWDESITWDELCALRSADFDVEVTGFDMPEQGADWFENRERGDRSREEGNEEYNEFLDKFEPKRTTDDCYTPDVVYEAVAEWVVKEYRVNRDRFVRPFYPGGDYQREKYAADAIVVDNPPFSILAEILNWYRDNGVDFFLFAPALTLFSSSSSSCAIPCGVGVTYENGAIVGTSFLTSLEDDALRVRTAPSLYKAVQAANDEWTKGLRKELPKYSYPDEVVTAAMLGRYSKYGIDFKLTKAETEPISALDSQKGEGKAIYGKGYLLSERAAAERAAAEKAAAEKAAAMRWPLSDREKEIVKRLGVNK